MKNSVALAIIYSLPLWALASALVAIPGKAVAGGVTIITHGLNGNVDGWITGMATNLARHAKFPGTNFTGYEMYFFSSNSAYYLTSARVAGTPPTNPESGEIIVMLDWRQLAGGSTYDTYQVAGAVLPALLSTNFIPELGGHALAEFPLHLIGHSRGGSLMCELSQLLGTNGIWVDHLTTLDPHPLNDPEFPLDWLVGSAEDAPAQTYENVLFHDNYWQDSGLFGVSGLPVAGAYVRELTVSSGGYSGLAEAHSDVHLWYHGTLDWRVPTSDTEASLTSSERSNWWVSHESGGTNAGFRYSLIGGSDRASTDQPLGAGLGEIRDGLNQRWDFGAGNTDNRVSLPANNGGWPSLIKFNRTTTNAVAQDESTPLRFCYQWAPPGPNLATLDIYLDADFNPLNTNQVLLRQIAAPDSGAGFVNVGITNLTLAASNAAPGLHAFFARLTAGTSTRYLYAPELVQVLPSRAPPTLGIAPLNATQFRIAVTGLPGQTIILQSSPDLAAWSPLATNTLTVSLWFYTNTPPTLPAQRYYRALLP
jgi:hypothetical protein